jgi:signal transduction histidine kinase
MELRERILHSRFTTKEHGHGLGLSLVRRVVGEAGGRLLFRDRDGGGTVFAAELPLVDPTTGRVAPPERAASLPPS